MPDNHDRRFALPAPYAVPKLQSKKKDGASKACQLENQVTAAKIAGYDQELRILVDTGESDGNWVLVSDVSGQTKRFSGRKVCKHANPSTDGGGDNSATNSD